MSATNDKLFFPNLDGFRFLSFFIVFLTHAIGGELIGIKEPAWYSYWRIKLFSEGGTLGVSFFFVLSGFLITYLLIKEREYTGKIHVGSFYMRRILRIWPLYYLIVFYAFALMPVLKPLIGKVSTETADPFLCSFFLNNFNIIENGSPVLTALAVLWSVAIEEQFYLIWPLLFAFIPSRFYLFIFIGVLLLSTLFRAFNLENIQMIEVHTLGVIADMAMGGLGAYLSIKSPKFLNFIKPMRRSFLIIPYLFVFVLFFFKSELFFEIPALLLFKRVIISFFFIWIILEQNFSDNSWFKMGNFEGITKWGKYTYGLYCLHPIAISFVTILLQKMHVLTAYWQLPVILLPLAFILSLSMSYISYHYFEKFFLRLKEKFAFISQK
ncbi:MAG: acyltransferase [Chitinophagaceae bacterium]|nr:acyltransferase [Chitinophagaceae bacterium]